jgi:hypothetical protein
VDQVGQDAQGLVDVDGRIKAMYLIEVDPVGLKPAQRPLDPRAEGDVMTTSTTSAMTELCIRGVDLMATGSPEDFKQIYHPQAVNREAVVEPPATRQPGPAGFYATAEWLRAAFSGLRWEVHETVERDGTRAAHSELLR